jgi:transcriptional regulator with XRE-family HTH domain
MTSVTAVHTPQQLGAYIKALRKARKLTQSDVARMLGVTKMRIAAIEKDVGRVSTASVMELVHLLGGTVLFEAPSLPARPTANPLQPAESNRTRSRGEW